MAFRYVKTPELEEFDLVNGKIKSNITKAMKKHNSNNKNYDDDDDDNNK